MHLSASESVIPRWRQREKGRRRLSSRRRKRLHSAISFNVSDQPSMDVDADLKTALAAVANRDLDSLKAAIEASPNVVPGLLARLEAAVDWEIHRRAGISYELLGPRTAVDDAEADVSLVTLAIMAACFRDGGRSESKPVADVLELTASARHTEIEPPSTLQ